MSGDGKKVATDISGGTNSSVRVYLLKEQGHGVVGVTTQIWQNEDTQVREESGGCCGLSAMGDIRHVAWKFDTPYYMMNSKQEFKEHVIDYLVDEYTCGRTSNPCIAYNRYVKRESLLKQSPDIGAEYIATGHCARTGQPPNGRYALHKSVMVAKDQTYVLCNLTQYQLAHTLMSVGGYSKEEIWTIVDKIHPQMVNKPDNQEIYFILDHDYVKFIEEGSDTHLSEGNPVGLDGNVLGHHKGVTHYAIGQRKRLNLSMKWPTFVVEIGPGTNKMVVGDPEGMLSDIPRCDRSDWTAINGPHGGEMQMTAKIHYSHKGASCVIRELEDGMVEYTPKEPQRAIIPGQAVVFYDGDYAVSGGIIR